MNKPFTSILLSTLAAGLSACGLPFVIGSGHIVSEERQVSYFDSITLKGSGELYITQEDHEGLKVETDDNILPYIHTQVFGNTLEISMDPLDYLTVHPSSPVRYYISMKDLKALAISGSGKAVSKHIITKDLDLTISGSGDIFIDQLKVDSLFTRISGSGKTILSGETGQQTITISGSGNYNSSNLESKEVRVNISGSGKSYVKVRDTLDITISGSGDVFYSGNPKITQRISGSGNIQAQ